MRTDELPLNPLLVGLYYIVPLTSDRVQIANGGRSVVLSGEGFAARVLPLLEALDGRTELGDLRRTFPDLVPDVLEALAAKGMLTDGSSLSEGTAALTDTALALGTISSAAEAAEILDPAVVAVVGCGPIGSTIAPLLSKAGVGRLLLCDSDETSPAEVSVSPCLSTTHCGQLRADATRTTCLASADTWIETAGRPREGDLDAANVDLAVVEIGYEHNDHPSPDADALLRSGIPFIVYTQDALEAVVGPLVMPGCAPCHRCARARLFSNREDLGEHRAYRAHRGRVARNPDAFLAAHCSIVAGTVATEVLRALTRTQPLDDALVIDLRGMTTTREKVLPVPGCPGCASGATVTQGGAH